jgi:hypothetical protein
MQIVRADSTLRSGVVWPDGSMVFLRIAGARWFENPFDQGGPGSSSCASSSSSLGCSFPGSGVSCSPKTRWHCARDSAGSSFRSVITTERSQVRNIHVIFQNAGCVVMSELQYESIATNCGGPDEIRRWRRRQCRFQEKGTDNRRCETTTYRGIEPVSEMAVRRAYRAAAVPAKLGSRTGETRPGTDILNAITAYLVRGFLRAALRWMARRSRRRRFARIVCRYPYAS